MTALAEATSGTVVTLCRCWLLRRRDGVALGFTDHDEPIEFDGVRYEAATGIDGAVSDASVGLAVDDAEIAGALSSDALDEDAIAAGSFDGAEVALYLVDWTDPAARTRLATYVVGEIVRLGGAFRAELRGLTALLEQPTARRFRRACDAELGDVRCGVDLSAKGRTLDTDVAAVSDDGVVLRDAGRADVEFGNGRIEWLSGRNVGTTTLVARSTFAGDVRTVRLWRDARHPIAVGDRLRLTAGCDKSLAMCRERYGNAVNHRGFPHLPGNDFAFSYVAPSGVHDGRPLVE